MSVTASRVVQVLYSGDVTLNVIQSALDNTTSIATEQIISLVLGNNTISPPVVSGLTITGLTIIPPAGNTVLITLKGLSSDGGYPLHKTDPFSTGLDSSFGSLVLSASGTINGVRLIWS